MKKYLFTGFLCLVFLGMAWAQPIQITTNLPYHSPNNKACKGKSYSFTWTAHGHSELIKVRLRRTVDGTTSEVMVIGTDLPCNGSLNWTIPNTLPSGYGYSVNFQTMAGHYSVSTGMFYIQRCLRPVGKVQKLKPRLKPKPVSMGSLQPVEYEQYEQGAIRMDPETLTVRWGDHTLVIHSNEEKWINIDEDSEWIDQATHGLKATIEYTLRNTLSKNFRFHVTGCFGGRFFSPAQLVRFVGPSTQYVVQNVVLYPQGQTLRIGVEATDILISGGANDVRPVYFRARLHVRVYPN